MSTRIAVNDLDKVKPLRFAMFMIVATLLCIIIFGYQMMLSATTMFFVVVVFMAKLIKGITGFFSKH